MKKTITAALVALALLSAPAGAQVRGGFLSGGTSVPCDGADHIVWQYPGGILGGGAFPTGPFTIIGAAVTAQTNDPAAQTLAGQLDPLVDALAPVVPGQGVSYMPPGVTIKNDNVTNAIHLHGLCGRFGPGYNMMVWLTVWYTVP